VSRPKTLAAWLAYLETLHPQAISLGLDRVRVVHARLDQLTVAPVVTVAGTNGKGSTCAMLEAILRSAGFATGLYTSPHLLRYNERIRIKGQEISDVDLVSAFHAVEDARTVASPATPLTYFEFGTLAALWLFAQTPLEALVLEVGLGGRLDAVNLVDADVAVLTSVALDHTDYLGTTREAIGREKAGIFRSGKPAVCAELDLPASVTEHAHAIGARIVQIGRDYGFAANHAQWQYWGPGGERFGLPFPALRGAYQLANAATVLAILGLLGDVLPLSAGAIRDGLLNVELPARFQVLPGRPTTILDVAHNPHAARTLANALGTMGYFPETFAVWGMLGDKDIEGVAEALKSHVDHWHIGSVRGPRGARATALREALIKIGVDESVIHIFDDVGEAYWAAREGADEADRIIVFGSFLTVAAALAA